MHVGARIGSILIVIAGCGGVRAPSVREAASSCEGDASTCSPPSRVACPDEMVLVAGRFCIDRYEAAMVDDRTGRRFSPFYPPDLVEMRKAVNGQPWGLAALGRAELRPPVPLLPEWQREPDTRARAVSQRGVVPQGYLSKPTAKAACEAAGKRLCRLAEWRIACRGERDMPFPYGSSYRDRACNVHLPHHGAAILWGDASRGHWDPRINQLEVEGAPLLKPTGETPACRSAWGDDGVYDMVGNLDEWVDDPATKGTFVGGFYARDTVRGCDAKVTEHPGVFFDFSTGVRCCKDLPAP
jgi:hypothetical protein